MAKKKKKMTGMSMIALRNQTVAREFLPLFDSANGCLCQERLLSSRNFATMVTCSDRSRPSDKGGGSHPDPEISGGASLKKKVLSVLWASVWSKNKGGPVRTLPLDPSLTWCMVFGQERDKTLSTSCNINKTCYVRGVCYFSIPLYLQVIEPISLENGI